MNKSILKIAIPSILANITVPLLSIVDITIAGHLGAISNLCAVSVGAAIINMLYWTFGFIRMSTSGLTAQAYGAKANVEIPNLLCRSLFVSATAALLVFFLKDAAQEVVMNYMQTTPDVEKDVSRYLNIVIMGAPAVFFLFSFKGWFIGMQNSIFPMAIAISVNLLNIFFSILLAYNYGLGIEGIALGSLLAQYFGISLAIILFFLKYKKLTKSIKIRLIFERNKLKRFFKLNGAISVRTICLTLVTTFFTFAGGKQGEVVLAANTLLMQMFSIFSYFTDGFAYAGEAICGKYYGAKDHKNYILCIKNLFYLGGFLALIFTLIYYFSAENILSFLAQDESVITYSSAYKPWVVAIPICSFAAFIWDGIMIGSTMSKAMAITMLIATIIFFCTYNFLLPVFGNNGLWLAFIFYLAARGLFQSIFFFMQGQKPLQI